jgi:excisionase family DNA binding protein
LTEEEREAADPWLTLAEIAAELRVNPATVRQWVSKGQLKASRAGVRKWIVRRSDLDRMLDETNLTADEVLEQLEHSLEPAREAAPSARRPDPGPAEAAARADEPTAAPTPTRKPRTPKAQGAVELLQRAIAGYEEAINASAFAPPSPGYVARIRAIAESCEHMAATMLNASEAAGVRWRSKTDMAEFLPYELKRGGNRPGPAEMWEEFDAAFERLSITATGTDIVAVAYVFREVWAALRGVADELEGGQRSQGDAGGGRVVSDGPEGV